MAYYRNFPWNDSQIQAAWIVSAIINANPYRRGPAVTVQELLRPELTEEQQAEQVDSVFGLLIQSGALKKASP